MPVASPASTEGLHHWDFSAMNKLKTWAYSEMGIQE